MDKIAYVENKIKNKIIHDGINATEFLLTHFYEENSSSITNRLKLSVKKIISGVIESIPLKRLDISKSHKSKYQNKKYVYIQMFDTDDSRHFNVLDSLIQKMTNNSNRKYTLVITNNKRVADYYKLKGLDVVILKLPKFMGIKKSNPNLNFEENLLINKCISIYEKAKKLFVEWDTKIIFTTQDFHFYDQIFTKAANKLGIISVTHQHGMIPYPSPGLFRYMYSTFIMVWGKSSYDTLKKYISEQRIIISGTDKFNYLLNEPCDIIRRSITLALNPIDEKINRKIIYHIFRALSDNINALKEIDSLIVKLHPSLNKNHYQEIIQEILVANNFNVNYDIFESDNFTVLYRTKIFIGYLTTLSLEAMIAGCSVIELSIETDENVPYENRLFINLPESKVQYSNIKDELLERVMNTKYDYEIQMKQKRIINHEIHDFSIQTELKYIKDVIKLKG